MKKGVIILILIILHYSVLGQDKSKWKYFSKYSSSKRDSICENWGQFFKVDLNLNSKVKIFPIKLDSYGSIYPVPEILNVIEENDFTHYNRNDIDMFKYSLYETSIINMRRITKASNKLLDNKTKAAYLEILGQLKNEEYEDYSSKSVADFYSKWDTFHLSKLLEDLRTEILSGYTQVIFFVHGYNVPYSLASVQNVEIALSIDSLQNNGKIPAGQKILYVPIYWPSNDQKFCSLGSLAGFNTDNIKGLINGGPNNGIRFLYYSNRAYYAAITLRKILNAIQSIESVKFSLISHSLGAVVVTSALINTYSKLQSDYVPFMKTYKKSAPNDLILEEMKENEELTYDIFVGLNGNPTPTLTMNVFLSAPSIPGVNTFIDMPDNTTNITYYCTRNTNDEMLTKDAITLFGVKLPIKSSWLNASTLGCDFEGDISATKEVFQSKNGHSQNFIFSDVSSMKDHDILTYIQQPKYIDFLTKFMNSTK